jgi:hypothetical protein
MLTSVNINPGTNRMIPAGYMAKRIVSRSQVFENMDSIYATTQLFEKTDIVDIYSVSGCISKDFADYTNFWKHNGYWIFDSPQIVQQIAEEHSIELAGTKIFYYEMYNQEFHGHNEWKSFEPEASFTTDVEKPSRKNLEGYDIVTFSCGNSPECSPLSCNYYATTIPVNKHCLLSSFDNAYQLLEDGQFQGSEAGPFRIMAVYSVL